jgi:hypothetical protein
MESSKENKHATLEMFNVELAMVLHYYHWLWYIILTLICVRKGFWHLNIYHNMNFIVVKGLRLKPFWFFSSSPHSLDLFRFSNRI